MDFGSLGLRTSEMTLRSSGMSGWKTAAIEGKSPVRERPRGRLGSRVPRDTGNLVGSRGDHPPSLNTTW